MTAQTQTQTLLIVDDCKMMSHFLHHIFTGQYNTAVVNNPNEALEWLENGFIPDAILLDYEMEEMNGHQMVQAIKSKHKNMPVMMLSGKKNVELRIDCLSAGANDFMTKPFHPKELELRVTALFAK